MTISPPLVLFAQVKVQVQPQLPAKKGPPRNLDPSEYIFPFLMLLGVLFVSVAAFVIIRRKFEASRESEVDSHTILSEFREAHNEGELSDEEFRKIKRRMEADIVRPDPDGRKGGDPAKRNKPPGPPKVQPKPKPPEDPPHDQDLAATDEMPSQ